MEHMCRGSVSIMTARVNHNGPIQYHSSILVWRIAHMGLAILSDVKYTKWFLPYQKAVRTNQTKRISISSTHKSPTC